MKKRESVNPPAAGAPLSFTPMQEIWLERPDVKRKTKLTLVGPPWTEVGTSVKHQGRVWIVAKARMTKGIALPPQGG